MKHRSAPSQMNINPHTEDMFPSVFITQHHISGFNKKVKSYARR